MFSILSDCVVKQTRLSIHIKEHNGGAVIEYGGGVGELYMGHDERYVHLLCDGPFNQEEYSLLLCIIKKIEKSPDQRAYRPPFRYGQPNESWK